MDELVSTKPCSGELLARSAHCPAELSPMLAPGVPQKLPVGWQFGDDYSHLRIKKVHVGAC